MENEVNGTSSKEKTEKMLEPQMTTEQHLVTYLQNILKYQIAPLNFLDLRELVKEAQPKLNLYSFIQEKYPGSEFLTFLQKYPNIFKVNSDRSVQSMEASYCLKDEPLESYDEVDNVDMEEYISDPDSD